MNDLLKRRKEKLKVIGPILRDDWKSMIYFRELMARYDKDFRKQRTAYRALLSKYLSKWR
jgi:hypothetical protein